MAQLRDVHSGELIFEGTPIECVVAASELGGAAVSGSTPGMPAGVELMYDDVGLAFDADAVLRAHRENAEGLAGAAAAAPPGSDQRDELDQAAAAAAADIEPRPEVIDNAAATLERVRARR